MKKSIFILPILLVISITQVLSQRNRAPYSSGLFGKTDPFSILTIRFEPGRAHNHPLMAFWLADSKGQYIQTLFVAESIGKGRFKRADRSTGKWLAGAIQRPAALPFWAHQRNVRNELGTFNPTPKNPIADAFTGATPPGAFTMYFITNEPLSGTYKVYMEINQSWDWNNYWHNNKFPDDNEYKTSSQPAVIYEATIDTNQAQKEISFQLVGRSHHSGIDGNMYIDLIHLTTARQIVSKVTVSVQP